jgi:hypothetical protein
MSTKFSFLARAAVVTSILGLALPAFAQGNQSATPATPAAPVANAAKQSPGEVDHKGDNKGEKKQSAEKTAHKKMDPASPAKSDSGTK